MMNTTPVNFRVKTQCNAYVVGYQEGMNDIAEALRLGGVEAVAEWLKNNRHDTAR
jgi:hypothetical protein